MILLVRHALAVARAKWDGNDDHRPLTRRGERQAAALPQALAPFQVAQILSSPTTRCVATVRPLAEARYLPVSEVELLREGRENEALDLVLHATDDLVLCTHGDVVEVLVNRLREIGWPVPQLRRCQKGATWVLSAEGPCAYIPPPA